MREKRERGNEKVGGEKGVMRKRGEVEKRKGEEEKEGD